MFLEAASCGKPVVGGRSGGIQDAVVDGATGLLVAPESPEEIADALAQILADPALASRLGEQGRARVVEEFSWPRMAQRVREILDPNLPGKAESGLNVIYGLMGGLTGLTFFGKLD